HIRPIECCAAKAAHCWRSSECHSDKPVSFHAAAAAGRPKCNESGEKPGKKAEKRVVRFTRAARWRDRETWNARRLSLIPMPFTSEHARFRAARGLRRLGA